MSQQIAPVAAPYGNGVCNGIAGVAEGIFRGFKGSINAFGFGYQHNGCDEQNGNAQKRDSLLDGTPPLRSR